MRSQAPDRVRKLLREGHCQACGRPFRPGERRVRAAGGVVHRACAVYRPRRRAA